MSFRCVQRLAGQHKAPRPIEAHEHRVHNVASVSRNNAAIVKMRGIFKSRILGGKHEIDRGQIAS